MSKWNGTLAELRGALDKTLEYPDDVERVMRVVSPWSRALADRAMDGGVEHGRKSAEAEPNHVEMGGIAFDGHGFMVAV
ncbi:hypothetical protein [Tomitella gaofuii]|uniref:hypothetical protein n=1 Tax=Tomitella gaofuii TaxID=2760083 RepID=UPI0015F862FB|nr:hypothetical protein [Tomitella gaofuii]